MIKTLQRRFVVSAMAAIGLLLLVLLGAINIFSAISSEQQSNMLLELLSQPEGQHMRSGGPMDPLDRGVFQPALDENSRLSAVYFTVTRSGEKVLRVDTSRIATVDEEQALSLAQRVGTGEGSGRIEGFKYKTSTRENGLLVTTVFLDTGAQRSSALRLGALSLLVGLMCWAIMLLPVVFLSRRAIKPIAENMERQRRFVTDAGHELKTPLAIILANTEAMELHCGENKWSRNIRSQTIRLSSLTQNLLTLARAGESKTAQNCEDFSLTELVSETAESFGPSAELKHISMHASLRADTRVVANRQQMSQLLSILIDNAVKYCPEGGDIFIELFEEDKAVFRIENSVENSEMDLERLFDRFYRHDSSRNQQSGGSGIGLSAAKAIAEAHRGSISAEYVSENRIRFTVRI